MDFFERAGESLSAKGRSAAQKAKDMAELARLNAQAGRLEGKIKTWYQVIGEKVYHREKDQDHAGLEVEFDMVTGTFAEIGRIKKQIAALKGLQECPSCGEQVDESARFCPECGAKLEDPWTMQDGDEDVCETVQDDAAECGCEESGREECGCGNAQGAPDAEKEEMKEETL